MRYFTLEPNYFKKEGFGTLMGHYALMYCIYKDTGVTPCILNMNFKARNMISAMEFFNNFPEQNILYHQDVFPNLTKHFSILDEKDVSHDPWFIADMAQCSYQGIINAIKNTKANLMCSWVLQNKFIENRISEICNYLFEFGPNFIDQCRQLLPQTNKSITAICVRTEYKKIKTRHIKLSLNFYMEAMKHFDTSNTKYLIFSDNIDDAKKMFDPLLDQFDIEYTSKDLQSATGMCTMSLCDNIICANSGFSYWASRLNRHNKKTIICPCQFLEHHPNDMHVRALNYKWYPKEWIALDVV